MYTITLRGVRITESDTCFTSCLCLCYPKIEGAERGINPVRITFGRKKNQLIRIADRDGSLIVVFRFYDVWSRNATFGYRNRHFPLSSLSRLRCYLNL